ncbi:hypothetical protein C8R44DRAFT_882430 [Mycena epipterygia]|nr:hypothetical protein C8R44DRAFT_882430 [Mycena epipterygia]
MVGGIGLRKERKGNKWHASASGRPPLLAATRTRASVIHLRALRLSLSALNIPAKRAFHRYHYHLCRLLNPPFNTRRTNSLPIFARNLVDPQPVFTRGPPKSPAHARPKRGHSPHLLLAHHAVSDLESALLLRAARVTHVVSVLEEKARMPSIIPHPPSHTLHVPLADAPFAEPAGALGPMVAWEVLEGMEELQGAEVLEGAETDMFRDDACTSDAAFSGDAASRGSPDAACCGSPKWPSSGSPEWDGQDFFREVGFPANGEGKNVYLAQRGRRGGASRCVAARQRALWKEFRIIIIAPGFPSSASCTGLSESLRSESGITPTNFKTRTPAPALLRPCGTSKTRIITPISLPPPAPLIAIPTAAAPRPGGARAHLRAPELRLLQAAGRVGGGGCGWVSFFVEGDG